MSAAPAAPKFNNFRDAYCFAFKCRPERYESSLFFSSLYSFRTLPALPIWWFNRVLFAVDLDVIANLGRTASNEEFNAVITDLASADHIERSIRRGLMRIRISPAKLQAIRADIDNLIEVPAVANVLEGEKVAVDPSPGPAAQAMRGAGTSSRRLREAHRDITTGRPISEVLQLAKVTEEELIAEAKEAGARSPEMKWLYQYLTDLQRLRTADQEHEKLRRVLAAQAHELLELRQRASGSS